MWARMERFLAAAIPAAEKAVVRMALHPDDPPIPEPLGGVAQICSTLEQFRKIFFEIAPSNSNCMLFCQGCMTELLGPEKIYDAIAEMAAKDKIAWVHFRNVRGKAPNYEEVFVDEGDIDMFRVLQILHENGFDGVLVPDHTPQMTCGDPWRAGMAHALGWMSGSLNAIQRA